ncbi:MAG: Formamidopyrimidine-DNA glycosylase [Acidimicrobiales bacterium]|nr:Formamidopyrimidine-DNA glycosylase [Acidimicrobiales bacterium]
MPELAEVEKYRRLAEEALARPIADVFAPDDWYLKGGLTAPAVKAALKGRSFTAARRIGKQLLLDTDDDGPVLGLHFGMAGRLLVDGRAAITDLWWASNEELEKWDRFAIRFADGGDLRMRDSRRLGGVTLDPPESRLGPDALTITLGQLRSALGRSTAPLKARLMDQSRLAGVGNLAADEALWRAGLDPRREAASLDEKELRRLQRHLRQTMVDLLDRGGSHTGDLMPERAAQGVCPKDGAPLRRDRVGGRTTWWCPQHQL